jgi:hypothetical protein
MFPFRARGAAGFGVGVGVGVVMKHLDGSLLQLYPVAILQLTQPS